MGQFLKDVHVTVALVAIPQPLANRISERLSLHGDHDPGQFDIIKYPDTASCVDAIQREKVTAMCIWFRLLSPADFVAFIGNIRETHPLIPICLVGTTQD